MNNQMKYNEILHKNNINPNQSQNIDPSKKLNEMGVVINDLLLENSQLKDKVKYLEEKIKTIITEKIKEKQGKSETVTTTIVNNNNNNDNNNNNNDTENTFNVKTI